MSKRYQTPTDEPTYTGEGITFTTQTGSRLWAVEVPFPGRSAMRCTIRATSKTQALQFAIARHPSANPERIRVLSKTEAGGLL